MDSVNDYIDMHGVLKFNQYVKEYLKHKYSYIKSNHQKSKTIRYSKQLIELNTLKYIKYVLYLTKLSTSNIINETGYDLECNLNEIKYNTYTFIFSYGDNIMSITKDKVNKWCELMLDIPEDETFSNHYNVKLQYGNQKSTTMFDNGVCETKCPVYNVYRINSNGDEEVCFTINLGYRKTKYELDETEIVNNAFAIFYDDNNKKQTMLSFDYVKYIDE
jgi:hypothetical protein